MGIFGVKRASDESFCPSTVQLIFVCQGRGAGIKSGSYYIVLRVLGIV